MVLFIPAHTQLPLYFIPDLLKTSRILLIAPVLCPKSIEKGAGVLHEVKRIYLCSLESLGLGKVRVYSIINPKRRSNIFLTVAGTFAQ